MCVTICAWYLHNSCIMYNLCYMRVLQNCHLVHYRDEAYRENKQKLT